MKQSRVEAEAEGKKGGQTAKDNVEFLRIRQLDEAALIPKDATLRVISLPPLRISGSGSLELPW